MTNFLIAEKLLCDFDENYSESNRSCGVRPISRDVVLVNLYLMMTRALNDVWVC